MGLYDFTFYDLMNRNAATYGHKTAWEDVDGDRSLSFSGYKQQAERLACGLQKSGVQKGDRIGVVGKNSLEFFLIYGAAAALGAIVLPINWRLSADEVAFNLNDCTPKMVFADAEFQESINGVKENLPSVENFVSLGPGAGGFSDFAALLEQGDTPDVADVATDDGFVIIHTAAVAGRPRGALLSHGNVLCADMHLDYHCHITPDDVHLNILPLFHVGGLFMVTATFHVGATNLNVRKFDGPKAVSLIVEKGASILIEFPPILSSILEEQEKTGADISALKTVAGLESPETIEKYQKVTGGRFYVLYGQTETSCLATFGAYNEQPGSAGRPLPLTDVRLMDAYDREVPVGEVGEITVKGPMVFKGYWNLPEDNAYTFREGWHHTGDQGRFDEDGFLWYAGRMAEKELIKPGGENVYPAEVEKAILRHPHIEETVVIGVPDPKWKEGIKAACKLKPGETLTPQELIDFVGERIARYKKPQYVEFVESLPFLEDGTPDRAKVRDLYGGEQ